MWKTNGTWRINPPIGVWFLSLFYMAVSFTGLLGLINSSQHEGAAEPGLFIDDSPPDAWETGWAPYFMAFLLLLLLSSIGSLFGRSLARTILLGTLCSATCVAFIAEVVGMASYAASFGEDRSGILWVFSAWWRYTSLTPWLLWSAWLAANGWYLLGPRTQKFYSSSHA